MSYAEKMGDCWAVRYNNDPNFQDGPVICVFRHREAAERLYRELNAALEEAKR